MLSQRDRNVGMSDTVYYQDALRDAFPKTRYGGAKGAIYAAYRFIAPKVTKQFTERRARSIWEGTAARIDAEEADAIRLAQIEEIRRERSELRARLARLEEAIAMVDATEVGAAVAARGPNARAMGVAHSARTGRGVI